MSKNSKLILIFSSMCLILMAGFMSGAIKSDRWEITNLDISANFDRVSSEQIRLAIASSTDRSFFKIDIQQIRNNLEQVPWVQSVNVMKKWPDTLIVKVIEQKAIAVWNDTQLLNENGEIFEVDTSEDLASLPSIKGSDTQAKEILAKFFRFNEQLNQTGYEIREAIVSPRGSWLLQMSGGIAINLGTEQKDSKILRLVEIWVNLLNLKELPPQYIDLRYTNGLVVKWDETELLKFEEQNTIEKING